MPAFRELRRRGVIPGAALALAAYYLFLFVPLGRKAAYFDAPLQKAWKKLAVAAEQTNAAAIDFRQITNQLSETKQALAELEGGKRRALGRIELPAAVRARLSRPFELVEYLNERSKELDDLARLGRQNLVTLETGALNGLPEHTAETRQPELLWAALSLANDLLSAAIISKVSAVHTLQVPLVITNSDFSSLVEVPLQIELTGSASKVLAFMQSLPMRGEELKAQGITNAPPDKA